MPVVYRNEREKARELLAEVMGQHKEELLPLLELVQELQVTLEDVFDVVGRVWVERVLELSAEQVARERHQGKAGGEVVTVETTELVRFRQDHVAVITEYVWGDGDILAEYRCSPGIPVDCYKEGSRHAVLVSLREHRNHGDVMTFSSHRKVGGGFTRSQECWETDVYHRTRQMEVRIIFPKERRCRQSDDRPSGARSVFLASA